MLINGVELPVDVEEELQEFEFENATWTPDKLIASSPFRDDSRPSFYVWLRDTDKAPAGSWGDSGGSGNYIKGGFLSLLSYLRNEPIEDVVEYLEMKYGIGEGGKIHIKKIRLNKKSQRKQPLPMSLIEGLEPHNYLVNRGIPLSIQKALKVGFDPEKNAVCIPWFLPNGELGNVKYRKVDSKFFWYAKGGWSTGKLLFGIDILHKKDYLDTVYITEAEIDAMYIMAAGFPAVAVGGSKFSKEKRDLLLRTNVKKIVIVPDNDAAGMTLKDQIIEHMKGYKEIHVCYLPPQYKDPNEVKDINELKGYLTETRRVPLFNFKNMG